MRGRPRNMTQPSTNPPPADIPIRPRHLRAPQGDGEALIEPSAKTALAVIEANQHLDDTVLSDHFAPWLDQKKIGALRFIEKSALLGEAWEYTSAYRDIDLPGVDPESKIVLSGHQPELFHPGVWLKNFALDRIARENEWTVPINLVIDNDVALHTSIRVPTGSRAHPHIESVAIDAPYDHCAYEERPIVSPEIVRELPRRLRKLSTPQVWLSRSESLLADSWSRCLELSPKGAADRPLGETIARARHRLEGELGLQTLELPLSRVTQTYTFRAFSLCLIHHISRFREIYNRSLAEYRVVNKIRSSSHPVPALATDGNWLEAPYWIWTKDNPQRRRLFVSCGRSPDGRTVLSLTDLHQVQDISLLISADGSGAVEQWQYLEETCGIKIRPRALITTMYARLFLSDLFIHGIGGAKYDELTDAIIRRFFGIEPPQYMTVTGTVRLPIPRPDVSAADVRNVKQRIREIRFHPEKFVNDASPAIRTAAVEFAAKKADLLRQHQFQFRGASPEQFRALDDLNRQLSVLLADVEIRLRDEWKATERDCETNRLLGSREFSFVLHPADTLPDQLKKMAASS